MNKQEFKSGFGEARKALREASKTGCEAYKVVINSIAPIFKKIELTFSEPTSHRVMWYLIDKYGRKMEEFRNRKVWMR